MVRLKLIGIGILVVIFLGTGYLIYTNITISYEFNQRIGSYFELADQSSNAKQKSFYFDKFVNALQKYNLNVGKQAIYFSDAPKNDMSYKFDVTLSLQDRLHVLSLMDEKDMAYQQGMQQITMQEFCWFPIDEYAQKYYMDNGLWYFALTPNEQTDRCITKTNK